MPGKMKIKPPPEKPKKPPPFWLVAEPDTIGEVFRVKHGKSQMVMHGEKFSPQFGLFFVGFNHDGTKICTASEDRTARVFEVESGTQMKCFEHKSWVRTARFNTEGNWLCTASMDGIVRVWDVEQDTGKLLSVSKAMKEIASGRFALSAAFSPDSKVLATTSWDKTARVYNTRNWEEILKIQYMEDPPSLCFTTDSQRFATACGDCYARIHVTPEPLPEDYVPEEIPMRQLDLSKMKIDELKNRLKKRDMSDRGRKQELIERLEAIGGDKTPEEPPPDPTRSLQEFFHPDKVHDVNFSFDGNWLITACRDKFARILDIQTGQILAQYQHANWVTTVRLIEDTSVLCTACEDGFVRIWDVRNEKELVTLQIGGPVTCAQFSPDGKQVCVASKISFAQIFGLAF